MNTPQKTLIIGCGALAHDILDLQRANGWDAFELRCVPAQYHMKPQKIAPAVDKILRETEGIYAHRFVAFAECGTAGELDKVLERHAVDRIAGVHCYEFFAGTQAFEHLHDEEIGSFYLTDFMVKHFDGFILKGLGLDKHPELKELYFGNYKRVVYLSQRDLPELKTQAKQCAELLGLEFVHHHAGYGTLETDLNQQHVAFSPLAT